MMLTLPNEVFAKIIKLSNEEGMSVTAYVNKLCREAVE